jgi:hypothetical protein
MSLIASTAQALPTLSWNFDGNATDTMTGLAPSSTLGNPTYVPGKFGRGVNFPNATNTQSNVFIYNTVPVFSNTVGFTYAFWINFTQTISANQYIFGMYINGNLGTVAFYLVFTSTICGFRNTGASSDPSGLNIPFIPTPGQWYHFALSVTATTWNMYINGALQTGSGVYSAGQNLTNINGPLYIGARDGLAGANNAILDNFLLYNKALTTTQIQTIYNAGGVPPAYSSIDNRISVGPNLTGGAIRDFSPSPLTLSTFAATSVVSNPNSPFTGDASFDITTVDGAPSPPGIGGGASSYYFLNVNKLKFDFFSETSNSFLECWLYVPDGSTLGTYPGIVRRFPAASKSSDADWQLTAAPVSGTNIRITLFFLDQFGGRLNPSGLTSINAIIGQWNHVTMGWSSLNSRVYIGVNGNIVSGTRNLSANVSQYLATANTLIGNQVWDSGCLMSNFRIVNLGLNTLPYTTTYTVPTSPLGLFTQGTTALLIRTPAPSISVLADYSANPINLATYATGMTYVPTLSSGPFTSSPIEGSFLPTIFTDSCVFPTTLTKLNYDFFSATSNSFMELWWFAPAQTTTYSRFWMRSTGSSGNSNSWGDFQLSIAPSPASVGLVAATSATTQVSLASSQNFNLNAWNHISLSWNSTNTTAYISTNGVVSSLSLASRSTQYVSTSPITFCTQLDPGSLISNFRVVSGPATLPYISSFTPPTGPLGIYPTGTTVLLMRSVNPTLQLTGTPLLSQLSVAPVGAFSLRAVKGPTAKAVQVRPVAAFPPGAMTSNGPQSFGGYSFGGSGNYTVSYGTYGGQPAYNAFDNNTGTYWENSGFTYTGISGLSATANTYTGAISTTISSTPYLGDYLQIQLPNPITLTSYSIYGRSTYQGVGNARLPYTWVVAGSNDLGATWSTVDGTYSTTGFSYNSWGTWPTAISFTPSVLTTGYSWFRIVITSLITNGGSTQTINIGQWTLNGYNGTAWNTDFYADRLGNLLTAPVTGTNLATWLGGATGYVATWYDQSGAGNHASQGTAANQPQIQKGTKGPGYSVLFNGSTNNLTLGSGSFLSNTPYSVSTVERRNTASFPMFFFGRVGGASISGSLHIGYVTNTSLRFGLWASSSTDETISAYAGSAEPVGYNIQTFSTTSFMRNYRNAVLGSNNASTTPITNTDGTYSIGLVSTNYYSGEIYEILVFTKSLYDLDQTSSITQIYNNQLSYTGL